MSDPKTDTQPEMLNLENPNDNFGFEDAREHEALLLDLEGFEGPIDLLLALARDQKVDLAQISVLKLAEQYLDFIRSAQELRLEIAADYLVMAAWLAYLKSKLLIPVIEVTDETDGVQVAADLAFQLQRLDAMRTASKNLFALPHLGQERFGRGSPEARTIEETSEISCTLPDLLRAYAKQHGRVGAQNIQLGTQTLYAFESAVSRLRSYLGKVPDWNLLQNFLPDDLKQDLYTRSAIANTFLVGLQMVRRGVMEMKQEDTYAPIYLRSTKALVAQAAADDQTSTHIDASDLKQELS